MIKSQLAGVLRGVITQTLLPLADNSGRTVATEILLGTDAVLAQIREGKFHQLATDMQAGAALGMHTLAGDLANLVKTGKISLETAQNAVTDKNDLSQLLSVAGISPNSYQGNLNNYQSNPNVSSY
jgi:twitching motility protein PilT